MQPDQQNSNQPSAPPPGQLPYQVPDYLHLDPVTGQASKSHKIIKLIALVVFIILLLMGGGTAVFVWKQNAPEQRFYTALDNLMQTRYITRQFDVTSNGRSILSVVADSNFSNPVQPESKISYKLARPATSRSQKLTVSGDITVVDNQGFVARLTQAPPALLQKNAELNKWYEIENPTTSTKTNTANNFDYLKLRNTFNTVYGIATTGNLADTVRSQVMSYIKSNDVYVITKSHESVADGRKTTVYTVKINYQKLSNLEKRIAEVLNINPSEIIFNSNNDTTTFSIDNDRGRLTKIIQTASVAGQTSTTQTIETFKYPASLTVSAPESLTVLP